MDALTNSVKSDLESKLNTKVTILEQGKLSVYKGEHLTEHDINGESKEEMIGNAIEKFSLNKFRSVIFIRPVVSVEDNGQQIYFTYLSYKKV